MSVEHLGLRTAPQSQNSTLVWVEGNLNLVHSSPFHGQGQSHVVPNPIQPCPDPDLTPPCASVSPSGKWAGHPHSHPWG